MQVHSDAANRSLLLPDVMNHPEKTSLRKLQNRESVACCCNLAYQKHLYSAISFVIKNITSVVVLKFYTFAIVELERKEVWDVVSRRTTVCVALYLKLVDYHFLGTHNKD